MIKILHVIGLAHGGAGQHILSLADGCDRKRFESVVAMSASSPMRPDFEQHGIRVIPLALEHYGGLRGNLIAFGQLASIFRRERFDVIETHTSVAGALGRVAAKMFTKTPVVHMLHTFAAHPYRSALTRSVGVVTERQLDRFTDCYIAGSRAMVDRGVSLGIFTADKVVVISNGIDLAQYDPDLRPTPSAEVQSLGNAPAQVTVGFLGRLEQQKGAAYLIRAAALVGKQQSHVRFLIAGDGSLRPELERLTAQLRVDDTVTFVGWQHDSVAFLKQLDILAMPSLWEAFGLSAAEAMALEKPVIASHVEGLPEVVDNGRTGLLVPPADPEHLARAILELAADPLVRRTMGHHGRARVEAHFTLEQMVSHHEELFQRMTADRPPARVAPARAAAEVAFAATDDFRSAVTPNT